MRENEEMSLWNVFHVRKSWIFCVNLWKLIFPAWFRETTQFYSIKFVRYCAESPILLPLSLRGSPFLWKNTALSHSHSQRGQVHNKDIKERKMTDENGHKNGRIPEFLQNVLKRMWPFSFRRNLHSEAHLGHLGHRWGETCQHWPAWATALLLRVDPARVTGTKKV